MKLLDPAAWWFALSIPLLLLFYFLRWKHEPRTWSTLLFWKRLLRELEADTFWKKLQRDLLLWLQLSALLLLVLALLRPALRGADVSGQDVILIFDTSASMQAPAGDSTRLGLAKKFARNLLDRLPAESRVVVLSANTQARVELPWTRDHVLARETVNDLRAADLSTRLSSAISLASALAEKDRPTKIYLLGDSLSSLDPELPLPSSLEFVPFGKSLPNTAITGLALQPAADPGNGEKGERVRVLLANFTQKTEEGRLEIRLNGSLMAARSLWLLPGRAEAQFYLPPAEGSLEVHLDLPDPFPLDNQAWAILRPSNRIPVVDHTASGTLQRAIEALGKYALRGPGESHAGKAVHIMTGTGSLPFGNLLILGGTPPEEIGVVKEWRQGAILTHADPRHPMTRLLSLEMPAVEKVAVVNPASRAAPLLWSGSLPVAYTFEDLPRGRKVVYLAFNPAESNWPRFPSFLVFLDQALRTLSPEENLPYLSSGVLLNKAGIHKDSSGNLVAVNLFDEEESRLAISPPRAGAKIPGQTGKAVPGWREVWQFPVAALLPLLLLEWLAYSARRRG